MENEDKKLALQLYLQQLREGVKPSDAAPEGSVKNIAEAYAKAKGFKLSAPENIKVNPKVSKRIADAYEQMQHAPDDPKVQKAYRALIDETNAQYEDILKSGLKIEKIRDGEPNPYPNSKAVIDDIRNNKALKYFPTESGYGSNEEAFITKHPLLEKTKHLDIDGKPMLANDLFRVVHDYMGHAKDGNAFGATGEERAFMAHKQLYSPEAQKALASETRGQNSWVNYGPKGEANRANPAATQYADQKAGLMPDWILKDVAELDNPLKYKANALAKVAGKFAMPAVSVASSIVPAIADIKEGMPNTAAARMVSSLAPAGTGTLDEKLMQEAAIADKSPELLDEGYMATLKRIGERKAREGKSPLVESFSGETVDTSATEDSDFMNKVRASQRVNSGT